MSGWRDRSRDRSREENSRQHHYFADKEREGTYDREPVERYRSGWDRPPGRGQQQQRQPPHLHTGPSRGRRGPGGSYHQEDYVPDHRREPIGSSRDSNHPPTFNDTTRRGSASSATSKPQESAHPSPRERGMIETSGHKRKLSGSWTRDGGVTKFRGEPDETRRNSHERPDPPSIAASPRDHIPLPSPSTAAPTTPMVPTHPNPPSQRPPDPRLAQNARLKGTSFSSIFQEAAYAYVKSREARDTLAQAQADRNKHLDHFNAFPVMRDRYESRLEEARQGTNRAEAKLKAKSDPLDVICTEFARDSFLAKELEYMGTFLRQIKNELGGTESIAQFVKSLVPSPGQPQAQQPAVKPDELQQMSRELAELRKNQEDESKFRRELGDSFHKYKGESDRRSKVYEDKLAELGASQRDLRSDLDRIKDEQRAFIEESKKAEQLAATTRDAIDETSLSVDPIKIDHITEDKLLHIDSRCDTLQTQYKQLEPKVVELNSKIDSEIARLERQLKIQDETIDSIRNSVASDTEVIMEQFAAIDGGLQENNTQTSKVFAEMEECKAMVRAGKGLGPHQAALETIFNEFREGITREFTEFTVRHQEQKNILNTLDNHSKSLDSKFSKEIEVIQGKVAQYDNSLDGYLTAITHLDQRMSSFTTKEFYERVVQSLVAINPLLFNTTNQLQTYGQQLQQVVADHKKVSAAVQKLLSDQQRLTNQLQKSPQVSAKASPLGDKAPNGTKPEGTGPSEGPGSLAQALKDLESYRQSLEVVRQRLDQQIDTYNAKMADIRDWTISATEKLQYNNDVNSQMEKEVKQIQNYLNSTHSGSVTPTGPGTPTRSGTPTESQWRAVNSAGRPHVAISEDQPE